MRETGDAPIEIGILLYPGAQPASVHGLTDLFAIAAGIAGRLERAAMPALRVTHWQPHGSGARACVYDSAPLSEPDPRIVVVPPTLVELPSSDACDEIAGWLSERHANGAIVISVCSGAFLLAPTGLLDGRVVSTHWSCADALAAQYPRIAVTVDQRVIDHGRIITAGGFMAWVDIGLMLVERLLGVEARAATARFMFADRAEDAGPLPQPAGFVPPQAHADAAIRRAQEWVHLRDGRDVSLIEMAARARLGKRTFLRRFRTATGMTPIEYCRRVRLARARELLEAGAMPIKEIAVSLGYRDVPSFARIFRKRTGHAPGAYRSAFAAGGAASPAYALP